MGEGLALLGSCRHTKITVWMLVTSKLSRACVYSVFWVMCELLGFRFLRVGIWKTLPLYPLVC